MDSYLEYRHEDVKTARSDAVRQRPRLRGLYGWGYLYRHGRKETVMIPLSSEARKQAEDFMRETLQIYPTKKPEVNASRERMRERVITWTIEMIRQGFSEHGSRTVLPDMIWASDYWKAVRGAVLIAYGGKCYICQERAEEVHHIRPRHFHGSDAPDNLMPLCKRCHDEIHRRLDKGLTDMIESVTLSMEADTPRAQGKLEDF